jgi:hypothetical protein
MICAKGTAWMNVVADINSKGGPPVDSAIAGLSPQDQAVLKQPISAVSWVDYGAIVRMIVHYHKGNLQAIKEASASAAQQNLKGIYRAFLSLTSPRFVCNKIPLIWKQYFNSGQVSLEWVNEKNLIVRITGVEGMPQYHEYIFLPYIEEALRIAGAKNVFSYHTKCLAKGDDCCKIELRWE